MKKILSVFLSLALLLTVGTTAVLADKPGSTDTGFNGNGAPSGPHYNLNIIGVTQTKTADMTGSNGHVIFVPLDQKVRILLSEGDFQVLDANATDDGVATFQLPNPDPDNVGTTEYSVYVRALGKPNGSVTITPGVFTDEYGNWIPSEVSLEVTRKPGKNSFVNASKELLYVWIDIDDDGKLEHINLFSDDYYGYFWDYDNNGCKLLQMRFYEVSTTVPDEI